MNEKTFTLSLLPITVLILAALSLSGCGKTPDLLDPSNPINPIDSGDDTSKDSGMATQVLKLTNDYRVANGVAPLSLQTQLTAAAQGHAQSMNDLGFFSHTGDDGSSPGDRILEAGYRWKTWGENIANGYTTASAVMNGWINSSGHRANILNSSFKEIGIGYVSGKSTYWVQTFGAR